MFRDFLAVGEAILDVQPDSILDVGYRFFVGVSLAVAALQRRAGNKIAVRVTLKNDGKRDLFHAWIIEPWPRNANQIEKIAGLD